MKLKPELEILYGRFPVLGNVTGTAEAHNLAFLLQEAGADLGYNFRRIPRGVRSEELASALGERASGPRGYQPEEELTALAEKLDVDRALILERALILVEGFESSYGLGLLVGIRWLVVRENIDPEDVYEELRSWFPFLSVVSSSRNHVAVALKRMRQLTGGPRK